MCESKMAKRIAWLRKKFFWNLSSTSYFGKTNNNNNNKKKTKLTSKKSLNLSFKDILRFKEKTTLFPDSDIYT